MIAKLLNQASPRALLAGTFFVLLGPFLIVEFFPLQLDNVMEKGTYLAFHNIAEFFSIIVSVSVFSVGWYTYDQSRDRHALLLGTAFLAIGFIDFMHTMSNAAMPSFFTPNTTNKSTQFWIVARLLDASAFLISAYVYPQTQSRWLSKKMLMTAALALSGSVFTGIVFFSSYLPATAVPQIGLTPLKRALEFLVILLLVLAWVAYWKRMMKTGNRLLIYYLAAFIICIFSEAVFASYKTGFDTYNVLGHIYKAAAFCLIYRGVFIASVNAPYVSLVEAGGKINRLNAELERRVKERTAQLEATVRELEAFSYSVSHDLRAPLRAIDGYSRMIMKKQADQFDEETRRQFTLIRESARDMGKLIEDLLQLSRVGRKEPDKTELDMRQLIQATWEELQENNPNRRMTLKIDDLPPAWGDRSLIRQVLVNILCNAVKFTTIRDDARIEAGSYVVDSEVIYFIRDNGAGFDMKYYDKLFVVFQRLHSESEYEGTGIGLALVQRIIKRHGGRVWAEAEVGKGACFFFSLPARNG
jgi:signal transduction histidine kinase